MSPFLWLLASLLTAPPYDNLLPGETAFTLGYGPFITVPVPDVSPPRLVDGHLVLPAPGTTAGPQLLLRATPPLRPGDAYTFACRVSGAGRLELRADNGQGHVAVGRFAAGPDWQLVQLTFDARGTPPPDGLTYQLRVMPLPHPGPPGELAVDDLRLVFGAVAREAPAPELAVDVLTSVHGPTEAVRPGQTLTFGAVGHGGLVLEASLQSPEGVPVAGPWRWSGPGRHEVALDNVLPGWYRAVATAEDGARRSTVARDVWLLPDHRLDDVASPFAIDAAALDRAAEARAAGYRQVRLVAPWSQMVDGRGEPDFLPLAERLAPAFRARMEVVLAVQMTPAEALPKAWLTSRKMDSHGFAKGTPLADLAAFERWAAALGQWGFGRRLVFELDHEPFRSWHGEDYTQYLRRFAAALRAAAPEARIAGLGEGFTVSDGAHRAVFYDEVVKRQGLDELDRVSVHLPDPVGAAPESAMGVGVTALIDTLRPALPQSGREVQVLRRGSLAVDDSDAKALSTEQLAARLVRDWLAAWPLQPVLFETGWRGGLGPREAALEVWRTRYAAMRYLHRRDLGQGLVAVYGQEPGGPGLVALWDSADLRRRTAEPRLDGDGVEWVLPAQGGVMLRVRSLYGREMTEAYRGPCVVLAPGFAPVYLEGVSAAWLDALLAAATVRRHAPVTVAVWPEVRSSGPGLALRFENHGPATAAGELVLRGDPHWVAAVDRTGYRLPGYAAETRFVPLRRWGPVPGRIGWLAEAGDRLDGRMHRVMVLPAETRPAPVIDGVDDDWSPAGVLNLESGDALVAAADRIGADDASAKVRLRLDDRGLHLFAEIHDDQLAAGAGDVFANADGLELRLDLDLAGDAGEAAAGPDDYTVVFAPYVDDVFQGRTKVLRGAGSGPDLLRGGDVAARFQRRTAGWTVEATLPLTEAARTAMQAAGAFGCDLLLRDVDPGETVANLSYSGTTDRDPTRWAWCCLPPHGVVLTQDTEVAQPALPPALVRLGFDPSDTRERFTLRGRPGCRVRVMPQGEFIRGGFGLLVEQGAADDAAPFLSFSAPRAAAREVQVWVRGTPAGDEPLRLQASLGDERREAVIDGAWRRLSWALKPDVSVIGLAALGAGRCEVAEVTVVAIDLPDAPVPGGQYASR